MSAERAPRIEPSSVFVTVPALRSSVKNAAPRPGHELLLAARVIDPSQDRRARGDTADAGRGHFRHEYQGLPFTDLGTAFLWASAPMLLPSFAAWLIMRRIGILR